MLSIRDPVHGFVRADPLEAALVNSRPVQRLRFIHQLGFTFLVFPGAEHSRFGHVIGAMHLAGRVYDALCSKSGGMLPGESRAPERRLARAAALLHDLGHAPFSHSAEDLFEEGIDHEEMTRRLLGSPEIEEIFARHGDGITTADVRHLLQGGGTPTERLLAKIVSGELDVDKMDYLLRDSLFCGVRYGTYDLERLLDTILPIEDPETGEWGIGVDEGGVHALEALVMARYYMFTQVYFNVTGKALELHLNEWLEERGIRWPAEPEAFLAQDDVSVWSAL
ncbi:MAG TPA: HD domain-containing protein, partial [Thermoanaerobaculia bacterium]|nr:HD domain-containing protein [Thermoanaerobaculia bacterium]